MWVIFHPQVIYRISNVISKDQVIAEKKVLVNMLKNIKQNYNFNSKIKKN
jgi:hypothetical protein